MSNFYEDVIRRDPRFASAKRCSDLDLLEPVTRECVLAVVEEARRRGEALMVHETYRSSARQVLLYQRGVTRLREVGVHEYGLACDVVKCIDGDPSWKGSFALLGELGRQFGLVWGGDWGRSDRRPSFVDPVHLQRCTVARQLALFAGKFYPDASYDPYRDLVKIAGAAPRGPS